MAAPTPRVVITGLGLWTPFGPQGEGRERSWHALRDGRCLPIPLAPADPHTGSTFYGFPAPYRDRSCPDFDPLPRLYLDAAQEAAGDAGWNRTSQPAIDLDRVAVLVGLSKGRINRLESLHATTRDGPTAKPPSTPGWTAFWPHEASRAVAALVGARGPCLAPVAACATGLVAAIQGADMIRRGECDRAVVGAADASLTPFLLGAFQRMKVLAHVGEGDDPRQAVRPWDCDRSGFLVGEGAGMLVLERDDLAQRRGVLPYAEFAGGALGSDAYHLTDLNPDPTNLAALIGRALDQAGVRPDEIDHVNVHGTATRVNDPLECQAIRLALGAHADQVSCSANKAQMGHLLGAAGAAELAITCLAIRDQFAPPTLNLTHPAPGCDLDATPLVGHHRTIRAALKLSLGFGGHLAVAVLRRPEGPRREEPVS